MNTNYTLITIVSILVVAAIILLIYLLSKPEKFNGLVPVENMLAVTELISEANDRGCKVSDVILEAQKDPYNREKGAKAVDECNKYCPGLSKVGLDTLANIPGYFNNYMDQSGCCDKVYLDHESCCGF